MEEYRKILKKRRIIYLIISLITILSYATTLLIEMFKEEKTADDSFYLGLLSGMSFGIAIVSIVYILKINKGIKNTEKLNELYIMETDERLKYIELKTGKVTMFVISYLFLFGIIISYHFDKTVSMTLAYAIMVIALIKMIVKFYYRKKI